MTEADIADLELAHRPAFVCDRSGAVVHMNEMAEQRLGRLVDEAGRRRSARSLVYAAFDAMLRAAAEPTGPEAAPGLLPPAPESLVIMAVQLEGEFACRDPAVLVLLEADREAPAEILARDYGLTDAETRVAIALADGLDVDAIAASRRVAPATVRTQLKAIYAKTRSRGQAQLVGFVCGLGRRRAG